MLNIILALFYSILAGIFNGSWGVPQKYMDKWSEEAIWLPFSTFTFLIFPWLTLFIMCPTYYKIIPLIPAKEFLIMGAGGLIFGFGQVFFVKAFKYIGLGINFVINISICIVVSAIVPFGWNISLIGSGYFYMQFFGVILFLVAVILSSIAGSVRNKYQQKENVNNSTNCKNAKLLVLIGILFSVLAGIGSGIEGLTYLLVNPVVSKVSLEIIDGPLVASHIVAWCVFFTFTWIPYFLSFLYLGIKNNSLVTYRNSGTSKYWLWIAIASFSYWIGLVFFSQASLTIGGNLAPTIAWPLFMTFIILVSNFWGWLLKEWENAGRKAVTLMWISVILFIIAIIVFAISSVLKP